MAVLEAALNEALAGHGRVVMLAGEPAPPLLDYLGEMTWYLDTFFDRREGGIEVIGGMHKWVVPCNSRNQYFRKSKNAWDPGKS